MIRLLLGLTGCACLMLGPLAPSAVAQGAPSAAEKPETAWSRAVVEAKAAMMANPPAALSAADKALSLAAGEADPALASLTANWLKGEALNRMNRPQEAVAILDPAISAAEKRSAVTKLNGDLYMARAYGAGAAGDYAHALALYQKAHDVFAKLGEDRARAKSLQQVGAIYSDAHQYKKALDFYQRAGEAFSGDPSLNLARLNNVANSHRELGDYAQAEAGFREALALARDMKSATLEARILTNIAMVQIAQGKPAEAEATARAGLALSDKGEKNGWEPFLWGVRGQAAHAMGQNTRAADLIRLTFIGQDLAKTSMPFREFHDFAQGIYTTVGESGLALQHLKAFKRLDDEARDVAAGANTSLMGAQFDFASQELRLSKLRSDALERQVALERSQADQRTVILAGIALLGLIALAGGGVHYLSMRRSRNAIRKANQELGESNTALNKALKAKSEFLATTSHEIRTPLNGILGMAQLLLQRKDIAPDVKERVELMHTSSVTMKAIVDDILDMSKLESGTVSVEPTQFNLRELLQSVCAVWADSAAAKGVEFVTLLEDSPQRVLADDRRIRQIAFNLLSNATKFTEQGQVRVSARAERDKQCTSLVLEIVDTGCGIPPDQLETIFEPFHQVDGAKTRKHAGTGLGLSISRKLARAMGGDISVQSSLDGGSTFTLRMPVQETGRAGDAAGGGRIFLLVDANAFRPAIFEAMLASEAVEFITAEDVPDALAQLAGRSADAMLIFADSLQSVDAVMTLREATGEARLVAWLEPASGLEPPMLRLAGADEVIVDPFTPARALDVIREAGAASWNSYRKTALAGTAA